MTFIALHRDRGLHPDHSLATTRPLLTPDEATVCESAVHLLIELQALKDRREAELATACADAQAAGREEAARQMAPRLWAAWQQAADQAHLQTAALRQAAITLSLHIVERIATTLAPADVVGALALRAIDELAPSQAVVVRVHADLAATVRRHLAAHGHASTAIDVRADPALGLLDCRLDTPCGRLLAGLSSQLDRLAMALATTDTHEIAADEEGAP